MGAMLRALNSRGYDDIEAALHVRGCTSQAMLEAITGWFTAWFAREPDGKLGVDPCQRLPYAIVNKLCKAIFAEYDSGLQETATPTAALLNHYIEQTLKATAVDLVLHYGEDFDLGDRLPVRVPELNLVASAQITSIKLTYEATGRKVVPVFDNIEFGGDVT